MYRQMLTMRLYDRKAVSMQRQGRFGTYAQMEGQEACMVASTCPLEPRDWIVSSYRETGAMWMHGVPLKLLSLYWMGNEFGSRMPEGVNVLPVSIPVGSHPLHAVGLAYAGKYRQDGSVAVAYFGDGATSEGDVHEAMNHGRGVRGPVRLLLPEQPVCHFGCRCASRPPRRPLPRRPWPTAFPGVRVDGNDVMAVYAVMQRSGRARAARRRTDPDRGVYLPPRRPHHGGRSRPNTATTPRSSFGGSATRCCGYRKYLHARGAWSEDWEHELLEVCTGEGGAGHE